MYNSYQNGNMYQTPYSVPYSGFVPPQTNYTTQPPFAPQNANYAPQTPTQPQVQQQPAQFVSVEEFKTVQTEMGRIKRTIDGLLKKEKKGGEENG